MPITREASCTATPPGAISRGSWMFGAQLAQSTGSSASAWIIDTTCASEPIRMSVEAARPAAPSCATLAATSGIAGPGVKRTSTFSPYSRLKPSARRRAPTSPPAVFSPQISAS